jgi:hypothetical protein
VDKIRDRGYIECGILGVLWAMSIRVEGKEFPNQGTHGFLCQKNKVAKDDDKKLYKCWKQRICTITKGIKNKLG